MRFLYLFLLTGSAAYAQEKIELEAAPETPKATPMPTARPDLGFYRKPTDPKDVVRSTLDNMPVKVPDTSIVYTMPQRGSKYTPKPLIPFLPQKPKR